MGGKRVGVGDIELQQQVAEPEPPAFLEGHRDFLHRPVFTAQFGDRVDERTAAKIPRREPPFQRIEVPRICSTGDLSEARGCTKRRAR